MKRNSKCTRQGCSQKYLSQPGSAEATETAASFVIQMVFMLSERRTADD